MINFVVVIECLESFEKVLDELKILLIEEILRIEVVEDFGLYLEYLIL